MGWESVNMVRFDLGTLLQGQMRIAVIYVCAPLFVMYQLLHIVHTMYI